MTGLIATVCLGGLGFALWLSRRAARRTPTPPPRPISAQRLARLHIIDDQEAET